jgi:hypothetical protein
MLFAISGCGDFLFCQSKSKVMIKLNCKIWMFLFLLQSCIEDQTDKLDFTEWEREPNPVLRDTIDGIDYQVASDPHVFSENGTLYMTYTGDENDKPAIKLAKANALDSWSPYKTLISNVDPSGWDIYKETGFYRISSSGKHQIYYIGYPNEETYEAQIFLAEADNLLGPYSQMSSPIVSKGRIAGKNVYCMTSPSVVGHEGLLYITFIGWNNSPDRVSEVWVIGATSENEGHTWSDFQLIDARIGMEGQLTKKMDGSYIAVRTGEFKDREAIFYSTANHPFGPWVEKEDPILVQAGAPLEKDEIIAPQIFIDPTTGEELLFYTGADHAIGWWVMMARE